ncbi:hypothetical protein AVEN_196462-1 [Araneus ventricosus]|uniref:Uncharacterized protein n=1 Tax=Araneus ventricosus TaxID=182803 RepID=A0A4Y2AX44_ARAVE|nr:hypothetical protein AVEN_196462-1 [Araneus ventricosus]
MRITILLRPPPPLKTSLRRCTSSKLENRFTLSKLFIRGKSHMVRDQENTLVAVVPECNVWTEHQEQERIRRPTHVKPAKYPVPAAENRGSPSTERQLPKTLHAGLASLLRSCQTILPVAPPTGANDSPRTQQGGGKNSRQVREVILAEKSISEGRGEFTPLRMPYYGGVGPARREAKGSFEQKTILRNEVGDGFLF